MTADWLPPMRPVDEPMPLLTGHESLDELRRKIIKFSQAGSARQTQSQGPFRIMGSLSYDSLTTLVNSLSREACLDLFRMEQNYCLHFGASDQSNATAKHNGSLGTSRWT